MVVFDLPQWLLWLLTSGIAFFFWAMAVLMTMMIGNIVNGAIRNWWSK